MDPELDEDNNFGAKEKTIAKIILITLLSIIIIIILTYFVVRYSSKAFFNGLSQNTYYVLDVNANNKEKIISLIQQENQNYCDSLYKIEYYDMFPDGTSYSLYCRDEDNIKIGIDKVEADALKQYIKENGTAELR